MMIDISVLFRETAYLESLSKLVEMGGPVVLILLGVSVFISAIITLKLLQFLWLGLFTTKPLRKPVHLWITGDKSKAYALVATRKSPQARTLAHLMRGLEQEPDKNMDVREDVERVADEQMAQVRSYFKAIEAVVQIAPLLGLFGTVLGMIDAFQELQNAGAEIDPAILAGGIWVALLTTAIGLAIAIPCAFILYWFEAIADRIQQEIQSLVTSILTNRLTEERSKKEEPSSSEPKSINNAI